MNEKAEKLLAEILKWQKLQGMHLLRSLLPLILDTKTKRIVYELTNGKTTVAEIATKAGVATGTVSNWWSTWFSWGVLLKEGKRYIKIISLDEISFDEKGGKSG